MMKSDDGSDNKMGEKLGLLAKILLIIGGLNWAGVALRSKAADAPVKDLLQFAEPYASKLPIKFVSVQKMVYILVGASAAFQVSQLKR